MEVRPDKYAPVLRQQLNATIRDSAFVVPLLHEQELTGFVVLSIPNTSVSLNFEDHDLLKTAGQQIASYLVQERATEQLAESRQFEAYNRFTAFVMHDLKNAIAQQSLVVENAERHKRNPEFVDDAIETIKGSVQRMRRVMRHLQQDAVHVTTERVDITKLLLRAESQCSDRNPPPVASVPQRTLAVKANHDRLLSSLSHAIRNAQDACQENGKVSIGVREEDGLCCVDITDDGCGMEADFIRDRLFRPFDSTKGAEGMGIGAYQIRETAHAFGGDVYVQSTVGVGTTLTLCLPIATGTTE
jgi:putative PEP-CTERM system histidine kinase